MSFHGSGDEMKKEIEELEKLEQDLSQDSSSEKEYGSEISREAWLLNKETNIDYDHENMKELVSRYSEHFEEFYENDPSNVLDYLDQFDGDIDAAINSFRE